VQAGAKVAGIRPDEVMIPGRWKQQIIARRHAMVFLREAGWSTTQIARVWGLDHSTVVHHLQVANRARIAQDKQDG
jgi:chromosomal replication initiation ATPase DnaA